ncbi:alpha/beta hydrolase [Pseudoduganella ginsengisoli]|uniref:Alpha/beta fold hydrolase n=1 Tax=Pseudoduganella ginsengisoli TaxID=1462440 RepID=A0A6L6Q687_9BURK|nr:alpha/beta hydrolase [Pseudoduganella ginsengisoli]MTW05200.1 alpha/beta fold hydrolase [Pseudoduganella ginsengisoli]
MKTNFKLSNSRTLAYTLGATALLAASYAMVRSKTRQVERAHPPDGNFVIIDGVRLHYLSKGHGPTVVLLHGNGTPAEDFRNAGLLDQLAQEHHVIAFNRPGYGYSDRPRTTVWTPDAQAQLLAAALAQLGIQRAVVLAHSWGAMVALALARQQPALVSGLVLAAGYYYPSVRLDVLTGTPALPVLGDVMRYTVSPLVGRLMWPLVVKRAFSPNPVPASFRRYPKWMSLRPGQLRAEAAETALMIPAAAMLKKHYPELRMPVEIIAGEDDKISATGHNAQRLHEDIAHSGLTVLPGTGHMVQHVAPHVLVQAVERVLRASEAEALAGLGHDGWRPVTARPAGHEHPAAR